ncbi:MAG: hypothetical protein AABZ11_07015 [Nitrospinota bacterium]
MLLNGKRRMLNKNISKQVLRQKGLRREKVDVLWKNQEIKGRTLLLEIFEFLSNIPAIDLDV